MIVQRLEAVAERVEAAATRVGRTAADIEVVAISKKQPNERIVAAYEAGHRVFGENRAAELQQHVALLPDDARWHMVGHLQRNKVHAVAPLVEVLHSLDSERLARAWARGAASVPAYVQVNLAGEEQKGGVAPGDLRSLLSVAEEVSVPVVGLMVLPPYSPNAEDSRPWFRALRELRDEVRADHPTVRGLSMGMSGDFEIAIEEGSTSIRLGTTIFGPRQA